MGQLGVLRIDDHAGQGAADEPVVHGLLLVGGLTDIDFDGGPSWFIDCSGSVRSTGDLTTETYQIEEMKTYTAIHVGTNEPGEGFRVDDTYVLHLARPLSLEEVLDKASSQ